MVHHIRKANSVDAPSGDALDATGPDTLIVDAGAFLISEGGGVAGVSLQGPWTITINGTIKGLGLEFGLQVEPSIPSDVSHLKIGKTGHIFGTDIGLVFDDAGKIINKGTITGNSNALEVTDNNVTVVNSGLIRSTGEDGLFHAGSGVLTLVNTGKIKVGAGFDAIIAGEAHITNSGKFVGDVNVDTGSTFTDFKKIGGVDKNGTVVGVINLHSGTNTFTGGANAETVRDGGGTDTVKLGGGNDTYLAIPSGGSPGDGHISGGKGTDTYDASAAGTGVFINLDSTGHGLSAPHTANGATGSDIITGFEKVLGGLGGDFLYGSSRTNTLIGGGGGDHLYGFGDHDVLTGGTGADTFVFEKLSDSTSKASGRDLITDFSQGDVDKIDLSAIDANGGAAGDGIFSFIGTGQFSHARGELHESFSGGNTIVSGDVNGDGKADFAVALTGHLLLTSGDFDL
jgi:Ca2+-binding RTX toxin-like protein